MLTSRSTANESRPARHCTDPSEDRSFEVVSAAENESLLLRMSYPVPEVAVMSVAGEVDLATMPRLSRLLWPRLKTTLAVLVIDLREVTFLGVAGVELLVAAHAHAGHRGIPLCVVTGARALDRVLEIGNPELPRFETVAAAVSALKTRTGGPDIPRPTPA